MWVAAIGESRQASETMTDVADGRIVFALPGEFSSFLLKKQCNP